MARAFPASRFVGYDFSAEGRRGRTRTRRRALGLTNATFVDRDAATSARGRGFDLITAFDAIHDQARAGARAGGHPRRAAAGRHVYLCVDIAASSDLADNIDHPLGPFLYTVSTCTA